MEKLINMQRFKLEHDALKYKREEYPEADWAGDSALWVNGKMIVCPTCQGTGSHVRRDIDDSRLVDMYHEDGDYDGLERYFKGAFDEVCTQCKGKNVVLDANYESVPEWARNAIDDWNQAEWEYQREVAAERRMGA